VELEGSIVVNEIKVAPMHKLIKRAGAGRVSEESAIALGRALEEIGVKVAKEAIDYAHHAGRKTVKARDIEIAAQKVLER
jgi:histone H3/H4